MGFLWINGHTSPGSIVFALLLAAFGTAASDVIIDAIMVENGKRTGLTARFQSVQWLWMSIGAIISSLLGGYLTEVLEPGSALHTAALITLFAPLLAAIASWLIVQEEKSIINFVEMRATTASFFEAFQSTTLWGVIAVLAFWNFSPSIGTPWYYHQTDTLKFSQGFIGTLDACTSLGGILGAFAYWRYFANWPLRRQLSFGIWSGTLATLLFLLLLKPTGASAAIAVGVNLVVGIAGMISQLSMLTLAAQACPAKAEGFTFAVLMSVTNGMMQFSAIIGARLYTDVFRSMLPLILVSAALTFACFLVMPLISRTKIEVRPAR